MPAIWRPCVFIWCVFTIHLWTPSFRHLCKIAPCSGMCTSLISELKLMRVFAPVLRAEQGCTSFCYAGGIYCSVSQVVSSFRQSAKGSTPASPVKLPNQTEAFSFLHMECSPFFLPHFWLAFFSRIEIEFLGIRGTKWGSDLTYVPDSFSSFSMIWWSAGWYILIKRCVKFYCSGMLSILLIILVNLFKIREFCEGE